MFDLRSYPGLGRAAPAYGVMAEELEADLAKHNPIGRIDLLAKAKLPVGIIHGNDDKVVPQKQNSAALFERYQHEDAADAAKLIIAEGQGHNLWEGFFRCRELIDFAIQRAKAGAEPEKAGN